MADSETFLYDVFLSYSAKDKAVARDVAERLQRDNVRVWFDEWALKVGDSIPAKIEEGLERSRVLVLCMSANAFGSDWAQLESGTFRFRDPLNKERRFLPLRLDNSPIKASLAQLLYINWLPVNREGEYEKLLEACRMLIEQDKSSYQSASEMLLQGGDEEVVTAIALSPNGNLALIGNQDKTVKLWDLKAFRCLQIFEELKLTGAHIEWSEDGSRALICSANGNSVLLNPHNGKVITDFTKSRVTTSQMLFFRMIGAGLSAAEIEKKCNVHHLTGWGHLRALRDNLGLRTMDELRHFVGRFYGDRSRQGYPLLSAPREFAAAIAWRVERDLAFSAKLASDHSLRLFSGLPHFSTLMESAKERDPEPWKIAWGGDFSRAIRGCDNGTLELWDLGLKKCVHVFEGHTDRIESLSWNVELNLILSGSRDRTLRLWGIDSGMCRLISGEHDSPVIHVSWDIQRRRVISGDTKGRIRMWELSYPILPPLRELRSFARTAPRIPDQIQYTNAKVLLVGDTHAGKTALTQRLATGKWAPSSDSTVGAWSTQVKLGYGATEPGVDREIWLWDFGGQADQRLIHQLYMDRTALVLLLFNADQEDVLSGLRDWRTALQRSVKERIPHFLVAGRIDTGFKASRGKLQAYADEQEFAYHETSAKTGEGCDKLRVAMIAGIPWAQMEKRTSPRIFKLVKDEILKLRDEGQVLHTYKELRELLRRRLPGGPRFTDETLQTVIGLLDGPGVVTELDYGTYILLAPEWISAYAQAVIRTLRSTENGLGVLPLRSIAEGRLIYQSVGRRGAPVEMKRLPPAEERVVLAEMERQLEQRGLCLRQGDKLVFPSHCGRDRPAVTEHPSVFVSYVVKGFLDDIYATLVVRLADSESFQLKELWRDAADFVTLADDHHMGIKLTRESGSDGEICIYFGKGVTQEEQVIFANYIDAHLKRSCEQVQRLRHYVCPKCHAPKGNPEILMRKLLSKKQDADTECDGCGERFPLWDALERRFSSQDVFRHVIELQTVDDVRLDSRRKGKLLALEVGSRITSADQKCFEIPATEDEGIDMELEFTNDEGKGTGKRLYLQLKSGNSHLEKRKDGREIFAIREQRWVEYWLAQKDPVMLVIGTFSEDGEQASGREKLEFADVRWMEISSVLKRESRNGTKPVKQIEFKGERLDLSSVRRCRDRVLASN